jgi:type I restriction enzyme S subunit
MVETKNTKPFYNSGIPYGWKLMELGELFAFKNGVNAGKESYGKGVKFINVMEVIYHDYIFPEMIPGTVQISEEQKELYLVKDGDVLFNRTSETAKEIGLSAVYSGNDDVVFGGFVIRGRPIINALDNTFKRYCFRSNLVRNQIIKGGQGAVRTNIGQGDLSQVKIVLPPLQEQKAIAALLGKWDEAITKTENLVIQKEHRKKWLMQNLLTGKMRLKGFSGEWKELRLCKVADIKKGEQLNKIELEKDDEYPAINGGISPSGYTNKWNTEANTITISEGGNSCGFINFISKRFWSGGHCYSLLNLRNSIKREFLFQALKFNEGKIMKLRVGSGLPNIQMKAISDYKLSIPSIEEQTAIAQVLQAADKELQLLKAKTDKLKEQKKGLMQVLLTGKKRLNLNLQD